MHLTVLMPVLDDWQAAGELLKRIDALPLREAKRLRILIVDDGSVNSVPEQAWRTLTLHRIDAVELLELPCNLGHQRAIAIGLAKLAAAGEDDAVLVMDSDGEDDPADIPRLLAALERSPNGVVVAERTERSEPVKFQLGYWAYRLLFRLLSGQSIRFGNFCVLGRRAVARIASSPDCWNHFAASLLRSRLPITSIPTRRGKRISGQSSMNLPALLSFGLSAIAVFSDRVFARLLLISTILAGVATAIAALVLYLRLATVYATPGWATEVVGVAAVLVVQLLVICMIASLQLLATRNQVGATPTELVDRFVSGRRVVLQRGADCSSR